MSEIRKPVTNDGQVMADKELKAVIRRLKKLNPSFEDIPEIPELEMCTRESIEEFGISLFEQWDAEGRPAKKKWMLLQAIFTYSEGLIDRIGANLDQLSKRSFRLGQWQVSTLEQIGTSRAISWIRWWGALERIVVSGKPIALRRDTHDALRRLLKARAVDDGELLEGLAPCDIPVEFRSEQRQPSDARHRHVLRTDLLAAMNARLLIDPTRIEKWVFDELKPVVNGLVFVDGNRKVTYFEEEWLTHEGTPIDVDDPVYPAAPIDFTESEVQAWGTFFSERCFVREETSIDQFAVRTLMQI